MLPPFFIPSKGQQISAKRGPDLKFVVEANSKALKPNGKIEVEFLDLKSSIESNIKTNIELLAKFFSIKVEFLLELEIKNLYKWFIVE